MQGANELPLKPFEPFGHTAADPTSRHVPKFGPHTIFVVAEDDSHAGREPRLQAVWLATKHGSTSETFDAMGIRAKSSRPSTRQPVSA
jgi:hypothetical protein